jgi:hypothetical protein
MIGGYRLSLTVLALACGCSGRDITVIGASPSSGRDVPVDDTRLDSDLPAGDVPTDSTPPTAGTTDSCSDPLSGDRYVLCNRASAKSTRSTGGVGVKSEELKGAKYRFKSWTLYAIQ